MPLKRAGEVVRRDGSPRDAFDRAEGFRYLSRLTRVALESYVEYADPSAPVLRRPAHETVKIGADNPDNYYQSATISGRDEYRIWGTRGTVYYRSGHVCRQLRFVRTVRPDRLPRGE